MRIHRILPTCLILILTGCARIPAPSGWLDSVALSQSSAYGGWVSIEGILGNNSTRYQEGELLAVEPDNLIILTLQNEVLYFPVANINTARLVPYDPEQYLITKWALTGMISTIPILPSLLGSESSLGSHGFLFVFSAPIWLLSGIIVHNVRLDEVVAKMSRADIDSLRKYARFPMGLPTGFDPANIRAKL